jgi:hypothetical protein
MQVKQLKKVQRYVTKRINGYSKLPYEERLRIRRLPMLCTRREYFDLVEIYKIIHGLSLVDKRIKVSFLSCTTRGHSFRMRQTKFRRNTRKAALLVRTINRWNVLPENVVDARSLSQFKTRLRSYLSIQ